MNAIVTIDPKIIESIVTRGDLSGLKEEQLVGYYNYRCQQVGLDPSAKPFDLLVLSGKKVLYANAGATQQLANLHGLSTQITNRERVEDVYLVSVRCIGKDGRSSENAGAVDIKGLAGEKLANALMKATTKAIRRTVLAHCGLGMLDETELETIPAPQMQRVNLPSVQPLTPLDAVLDKPYKLSVPEVKEGKVTPHPYESFDDSEDWSAGFFGLIGKIASSQKLSTEGKNAKLRDLFLVNESVFNTFVGDEASQFARRTEESGCGEFLPKQETLVVEAEI